MLTGWGWHHVFFVWHWDLRMEFWMLWMHGSGTLIKLWWAKLDDSTSWELKSWHEILIQDSTTASNNWHFLWKWWVAHDFNVGWTSPIWIWSPGFVICWKRLRRFWERSMSLDRWKWEIPWPLESQESASRPVNLRLRWEIQDSGNVSCLERIFWLFEWTNWVWDFSVSNPHFKSGVLVKKALFSRRSPDLTQNLGSFSGFNCTSKCIISVGERATHRAAEVGNLQTLRLQAVFRFPLWD